MRRFAGILAMVLVVCAGAISAGCAGQTGSADNGITVSANATAEIAPDRASLAFTMNAAGDTREDAGAAGDRAVGDIKGRLSALGIPEGSMEVGEAKLTERYGESGLTYETLGYEDEDGNWVESVEEVYYDDTESVVGYDAKVRVRIVDFDADKLGQVIREASEAGAGNFGGLSYGVSDREAAYQQALAQAVEAAHVKAESLAKAGSVYVGRVVNIVEDSSVPESLAAEADAGFIDVSKPESFEVIPDKLPVEAAVTVSYAIS